MRKTFTPGQIVTLLNRHGFVLNHTKGSHRIFVHPRKGDTVVVPFHKKDLPRGTLQAILKAAGIANEKF